MSPATGELETWSPLTYSRRSSRRRWSPDASTCSSAERARAAGAELERRRDVPARATAVVIGVQRVAEVARLLLDQHGPPRVAERGGFTHASSVMPAARSSEVESGTRHEVVAAVEAQRRAEAAVGRARRAGDRAGVAAARGVVRDLAGGLVEAPRADEARADRARRLGVRRGVGGGRAGRRELVRGGAAVRPRREVVGGPSQELCRRRGDADGRALRDRALERRRRGFAADRDGQAGGTLSNVSSTVFGSMRTDELAAQARTAGRASASSVMCDGYSWSG